MRVLGQMHADHKLKPSKGPKSKPGRKKVPQKVQVYDLHAPPVLQKEAFLAKLQFMIYLFLAKRQVDHKVPF